MGDVGRGGAWWRRGDLRVESGGDAGSQEYEVSGAGDVWRGGDGVEAGSVPCGVGSQEDSVKEVGMSGQVRARWGGIVGQEMEGSEA